MITILKTGAFAACLVASTSALAAERTVTLFVDGMTCASCPYIVKQTLASVDGVSKVRVSFADKVAIVTFDDSVTEVAALTSATAGAGFPSNPRK